jgi:hypothetical protein
MSFAAGRTIGVSGTIPSQTIPRLQEHTPLNKQLVVPPAGACRKDTFARYLGQVAFGRKQDLRRIP